jgi:hypothetical protein
VQGGVQLHHRGADLPAVDPGPVVAGHELGVDQAEGPPGVGVGDDRGRPDELAALQAHPLAGQDLDHRDPGGQLGAEVAGGLGDGERDAAHAALDIAPERALAEEVALVVHELDGGGARVLGAGPGADDPLAVQGVLHPLVVHVAVQGVGDRLLEQHRDQLGVVAEPLGQLVAGGGVALPGVALGPGPQGPAQPVEHVLVVEHPLDVALGEAVGPQVGHGPVMVDELGHRGPVGERDPQVGVGHEDPVAVALQPKLVDHRLVEQADHVRAGADQVAGVAEGLLQGAGAAEALAPLQDQHRPAGPGQVGGGGQAVVAAPDHDHVPGAGGQLGQGSGQADLPEGRGDGRGAHHISLTECSDNTLGPGTAGQPPCRGLRPVYPLGVYCTCGKVFEE